MRLDKLIEEKLETTRKEMKRLFALKQVMIDGTVELRQNRNVDSLLHQIEVAGEHLVTNESYYLLNKPEKAIRSRKDDSNRSDCKCRSFPTIISSGKTR